MRTIKTYLGYDIVESEYTTQLPNGEIRPVLVIPGLKASLWNPILMTIPEAQEYIRAEVEAREELEKANTEHFTRRLRTLGNGPIGITIPAEVRHSLGLNVGDAVEVWIKKSDSDPGE